MLFPTLAKAEQQFFETLYDVPVMQGLTEIPDMAMVFDKPNGRISQAGALMKGVSQESVKAFYTQTLPQLGWKINQSGIYTREGEKLTISFEGTEMVKLLVEPL